MITGCRRGVTRARSPVRHQSTLEPTRQRWKKLKNEVKKGPRNLQNFVPADYVIFAFYMYIFKDLLTCMGLNAEAKCSFNCAICFLCLVIF